MKQVSKYTIAIAAFASATIFSFGWSEQAGVTLSVESAQARVGRPLTPLSVAGVARRQTRRAYGYGVAGAAVGAAAVGAAAVAAGSYYGGPGYYSGGPYYGNNGYYGGPYRTGYYGGGPYAYHRDYATINEFKCQPGTMTKLDDGQMYLCQ